jgi:hypothetical protein
VGKGARITNSIIASGANITDGAHVNGLAVNDQAPTEPNGKKIELEA